ncbi:MAG: matrixin family metalloprotease [Oligoflexales bacterium]|nr:matrixin family metalloprotease [Oligoflexales bacterium]
MYQLSLEKDMDPRHEPNADSENPESPTYGIHALNGWRALPIHFRVGNRLSAEQKAGLVAAMATWEFVIGKKLFVFEGVHDGVDGDSFTDLYSSLNDGVNGHYLDADWHKTGKEEFVLATAIWNYTSSAGSTIDTADIRFNDENYVIADSLTARTQGEREVVDMQTLALHELGHLLGLSHISDAEIDPGSIMAPRLLIGEGLTKRRLTKGDILRIQQVYGCYDYACDVDDVVVKLEHRLNKSETTVETASTESGQLTAH